MNPDKSIISCPKCGEEIDVNDRLYHQVDKQLKEKYQLDLENEKKKYDDDAAKIKREKKKFEVEKKNLKEEISKQVNSEVKLQEVALKKKFKKEAEEEQSSAIKLMQEELKDKSAKIMTLNGTTIKLEQLKREKDELEKKIIAESADLDKNLVSDRAKIEKEESIEGKNAIEILILKKNMQSLKEKNKRIEGRYKSLEGKIQMFREKNHILKQNMKRLGDKYIEKCKEN